MSFLFASNLSDGRLQLWAVGPNRGELYTATQQSPTLNSAWTSWSKFEPIPQHNVLSSVFAQPLKDGRVQLWALSRDGFLQTIKQLTASPTSAWPSQWESQSQPAPPLLNSAAVMKLNDGSLQLVGALMLNTGDNLVTSWTKSSDPDSAWTDWAPFVPEMSGKTALVAGVGSLSDGRPQLWASTQGPVAKTYVTEKSSTAPGAAWSAWNYSGLMAAENNESFVTSFAGPPGVQQIWCNFAKATIEGSGSGLATTWRESSAPDAPFYDWQDPMEPDPPIVSALYAATVGRLSDGRGKLFVMDSGSSSFQIWTTNKSGVEKNAPWTPWTKLGQEVSD